ncbi:MAG: TolC family protein, partial [Acidobacteria bacterium]|nr:TolC family protein [Acidobacteriota bacterium]MDW7985561.1 TolC family protein [Acidobacteriota bacterium]
MRRISWLILPISLLTAWTISVVRGMAQTATPEPSVVPVRLSDLIRSALQKNLDLQWARLQPEFAEATVYQEEAAFQPQLTANFGTGSEQNPSASVLAGAPVIEQRRTNMGLGFSQRIAWGTLITINLNQNRMSTNSSFASLNPQYNSGLSIQVTQPLLRGFGPWNAQANLRAAEKRHQQSLQAFQEAQMDLLLQVVQAYWDLVFAQRNLEVQKNSLALAEKLLRDTEVQIEVGVKAPIERTAAQAEVAARRQNVVAATNLLQAATDRLKALVEAIEGLMH